MQLLRHSVPMHQRHMYLFCLQHCHYMTAFLFYTQHFPKLHTVIQAKTESLLKWTDICLHCNLYSWKMAHSTAWNNVKIVSKTHSSSWAILTPTYLFKNSFQIHSFLGSKFAGFGVFITIKMKKNCYLYAEYFTTL